VLVHLKSLTLRGFKSFASSTTLRFEPGITCVVGPNGSGKSNVVDAIAWVLGEQGAKSLRGGKMEDVIFAGTAGRPPLGRAEVILTIDNTDGALPIDYTEVTISRIMFRNGGSEYAINGNPCRLLDVQELLSDSGIGREMHVIVGQGQLDAVLHASPEDRRGFIEEAAGVLKHRKRKEKALRKLEAMQVNLNRLQDLTVELRRQLKPLGQQAEVARRAAVVQADLRDAKLRLLADDLSSLRSTLEAEVADETALLARRAEVERALAGAQAREAELEAAVAAGTPRLARAQETWYRLAGLRERFRGTASLAAERHRHGTEVIEEESAGRDPDALDAEAAQVRAEQSAIEQQLQADRTALAAAVELRQQLEVQLREEDQRLAAVHRAIADRREGLATLNGEVAAMRTRAKAADDEIGRLSTSLAAATERAAAAHRDYAAVESQIAGLDAGEVDLDARYESAAAALAEAEERLTALQDEEREVERQRSAAAARRDALALGLARRDGHGALLAAKDRLPGVLGTVAEVVSVEAGYEAAVAAALGAAADAVAVASLADAAAALRMLKQDEAGRAGIVVGGADYADGPSWPGLPSGVRYAVDVLTAPELLRPALARLLERVAVVTDLDEARRLTASEPGLRAVTAEGDLLGAAWAVGGSASTPSLLEIRAAHAEAERECADLGHRADRLRFALSAAAEETRRAQDDADDALAALHESDARLSAVAERLGQLGTAARAAADEAERVQRAVEAAKDARDHDLAGLAALEERLAAAEAAPDEHDPDVAERDRLAAVVTSSRTAEVEARLAVRTGEERSGSLAERAMSLEQAAVAERQAREKAARARERRARETVVAAAVLVVAQSALARLEHSLQLAADERSAADEARTVLEGELLAVRGRSRELGAELESLTGAVHRDEVVRAEQRMRIQQLEERAAEEFGLDAETLLGDYGPEVPVPVLNPAPSSSEADAAATTEAPTTTAYVREEQEKRLRAAERALALLGKINPLALEEFAALEERHAFLSTQLEDLKATRRDLLTVVKEVDERVEQIFRAAYIDVEREFEKVFSTLFPGGAGRLVMTDPDDWLMSGIEVEARPPGKKVKRLSLLSGGERSLTAVAFLVAIFRARPSPFYVLDEVEAALDDRNLSRLVDLLADLKSTSQLIIITHQKRTMEVADSLYGVSMRGDGITQVISQRLREPEPA
jgi:chromosome segregation protein